MSKYRSKKTEVDGVLFDSKHEATRWCELKYLERAHLIKDLSRQVPFIVVPAQRDENGKLVEHQVRYIADFVYTENGETVVEDAKGMKTPEYIIKRKLMLKEFGIRIKEV